VTTFKHELQREGRLFKRVSSLDNHNTPSSLSGFLLHEIRNTLHMIEAEIGARRRHRVLKGHRDIFERVPQARHEIAGSL
jgi:hypothetical protein